MGSLMGWGELGSLLAGTADGGNRHDVYPVECRRITRKLKKTCSSRRPPPGETGGGAGIVKRSLSRSVVVDEGIGIDGVGGDALVGLDVEARLAERVLERPGQVFRGGDADFVVGAVIEVVGAVALDAVGCPSADVGPLEIVVRVENYGSFFSGRDPWTTRRRSRW
jgi:hypothetical protein